MFICKFPIFYFFDLPYPKFKMWNFKNDFPSKWHELSLSQQSLIVNMNDKIIAHVKKLLNWLKEMLVWQFLKSRFANFDKGKIIV